MSQCHTGARPGALTVVLVAAGTAAAVTGIARAGLFSTHPPIGARLRRPHLLQAPGGGR